MAEVDGDQFEKLSANPDDESELKMDWARNTFAGEHWLLGKFKIELSPAQTSFGLIRRSVTNPAQMENINYFNFVFSFERLGDRVIRTLSPIVNAATITAIPPKGSTYRVEEPNRSIRLGVVRSGDLFAIEDAKAAFPAEFEAEIDLCEITLYERENIDLTLLDVSDRDGGSKSVRVRINHMEDVDCRIVYFNVLHDALIITQDDFGFFDLAPNTPREIEFTVRSKQPGHRTELPFFAGVYRPDELRGGAELTIPLTFQ